MNLKAIVIYSVVLVALSVAGTRYLWPQIETQTKIEEKEVVRTDVRTVIREVVKPDGSKETVTEIIDKSKQSSTKESLQITTRKNDWFVTAGVAAELGNFQQQTYNLQVNRRILGPIFLGVSGNTRREVGVAVGFEF